MGFRPSQLFDYEHEPVQERRSQFATHSGARAMTTIDLSRPAPAAAGRLDEDGPAMRQAVTAEITLSSLARNWAASLPATIEPAELCARYPRIANRLALCWPDRALALQVIQSLFVSKRVRRQGFPLEVASELMQLRDFAARELP